MFTAIVLDAASQEILRAKYGNLIANEGFDKFFGHHVTLAMGDASSKYKVGESRWLVVIGFGHIDGRVAALRVTGASDSRNGAPHITLATNSEVGAKPAESNRITNWLTFEESETFSLHGTVEVVF